MSHSQLTETRDTDSALVVRVGEGDVGAYRELVARYAPALLRFATRLLRDVTEAEDVVQETCLRLWQHAREYTPSARVTTWLHRIAHNLAVDRLRARGRLKPFPDEEDAAAMPESARQPSLLDEKRRALALDAALAELPERQAAALTLVHLHGLSGKEAAEVLGVGAEALESLLSRGRRALKAGLTQPRAAGAKGAS